MALQLCYMLHPAENLSPLRERPAGEGLLGLTRLKAATCRSTQWDDGHWHLSYPISPHSGNCRSSFLGFGLQRTLSELNACVFFILFLQSTPLSRREDEQQMSEGVCSHRIYTIKEHLTTLWLLSPEPSVSNSLLFFRLWVLLLSHHLGFYPNVLLWVWYSHHLLLSVQLPNCYYCHSKAQLEVNENKAAKWAK